MLNSEYCAGMVTLDVWGWPFSGRLLFCLGTSSRRLLERGASWLGVWLGGGGTPGVVMAEGTGLSIGPPSLPPPEGVIGPPGGTIGPPPPPRGTMGPPPPGGIGTIDSDTGAILRRKCLPLRVQRFCASGLTKVVSFGTKP